MKQPLKRPLEIKNIAIDKAEILIYGEIVTETPVDWWTGEPLDGYYSQAGFIKDLAELRNKSAIDIRINSAGGSIFAALAIYNLLSGMSAKKTVYIDGIAASAATLVMLAGDEVIAGNGSMFMIHEAMQPLCGYYNAGDLNGIMSALLKANDSVAEHYSGATGIDKEKVKELMAAETWMTAKEALELGFITAINDKSSVKVEITEKEEVVNINDIDFDMSMFRNAPDFAGLVAARIKRTVENRLREAGFTNKECELMTRALSHPVQGDPEPVAQGDPANDEVLRKLAEMTNKERI